MTIVFFNSNIKKFQNTAKGRAVAKAELRLEKLQQEIITRRKKLKELLGFLEESEKECCLLEESYQATPSEALLQKINKKKEALLQLRTKMEMQKPQQFIAELTAKHRQLTLKLKLLTSYHPV